MKRLPIPERFHYIAAQLGVGIRHFINDYAVRDDYLSMHEKGEIVLSKEEREYLINLMVGRSERSSKTRTRNDLTA